MTVGNNTVRRLALAYQRGTYTNRRQSLGICSESLNYCNRNCAKSDLVSFASVSHWYNLFGGYKSRNSPNIEIRVISFIPPLNCRILAARMSLLRLWEASSVPWRRRVVGRSRRLGLLGGRRVGRAHCSTGWCLLNIATDSGSIPSPGEFLDATCPHRLASSVGIDRKRKDRDTVNKHCTVGLGSDKIRFKI